jgi:hypothetical protein
MVFSVGAGAAGALLVGGAEVVAVVVVGVVVLDGACLPVVPHPAVSAPNAMSAAPLVTTTMRRPERPESMMKFLSIRRD